MAAAYSLEHLLDADLRLLARVAGERSDSDFRARLRSQPEELERLLLNPALWQTIFGRGSSEAFLHASPLLVFAVMVQRTAYDLRTASYIEEWSGPRQRVPLFDVASVRAFAMDAGRRLFLAELLASYTHVSSGTILVRTARGVRRRRFSDLDPARLAELAELAPASDRPAIVRRLGDLSLFLSGVFPDYAGRGLEALEDIGRRAYATSAEGTRGATASLLKDLSGQFRSGRRFLNRLTDRYLFPLRESWFPA